MTGKPLKLSQDVWEKVVAHAAAGYPAECCGILAEEADGTIVVHPCENIQDKLHAKDPSGHPRTSETAYRMDDLQVHRFLSETEDAGGRLRSFYHSHIDCDAYFSEEDHNAALFMDEPAYPEAVYLVISVCGGEVKGQKVFGWSGERRVFEEIPLDV